MNSLSKQTLQAPIVDNTVGELTRSSFASTGAPLRCLPRKVGRKTEMESFPHDWVPEPDWCSPNMKGSGVRFSPVDSILVEKDNLVLPNQNPESKIPRRKADEPSAAVAGGGSLKLETGVQVELKGSPLAQLGGVSFSSSCTSVSSPGDPLELKRIKTRGGWDQGV
jgi:hypothetical protein